MSTAAITVELPKPLLHEASKLAEQNGVSLSSWISLTVEQTLCDQKLTAEFYRRRALGKDAETLLALLDKAPDAPPLPGDEL